MVPSQEVASLFKKEGIKTLRKNKINYLSGVCNPSALAAASFGLFGVRLPGLVEFYIAWRDKNLISLKQQLKDKKFVYQTENILLDAEYSIIATLNYLLLKAKHVKPLLVTRGEKHHFSLVPFNLEAFILLQFTQAVTGNINYRACEICGKQMEITPDKRTQKKKFCSPACTMRDYRLRKEQKK
ncbi:MAG: hypothetical protein IIA70_03370 [Proteobacteria bacterium]|nr:hypothetical protein [Pseudomonadota bacterium]